MRKTMGGRRSRYWCGPGFSRETKLAPARGFIGQWSAPTFCSAGDPGRRFSFLKVNEKDRTLRQNTQAKRRTAIPTDPRQPSRVQTARSVPDRGQPLRHELHQTLRPLRTRDTRLLQVGSRGPGESAVQQAEQTAGNCAIGESVDCAEQNTSDCGCAIGARINGTHRSQEFSAVSSFQRDGCAVTIRSVRFPAWNRAEAWCGTRIPVSILSRRDSFFQTLA
jgi:hypothetical protein